MTHTVFGIGLYVWGLGLSFLLPLSAVAPAAAQDPCTISAAEREWRPSTGHRVAMIGPLATTAGRPYVARYMEAVFLPGMRTRVHRHSGPEAWYVLSGAQCLETPDGIIRAGAGESAVVSAGPPMVLSTVGQETRRAVLLVLHDAAQPWTTPDEGWEPRGACPP